MALREYEICTNCIMDTTDAKITFDEKGVCDYCRSFVSDIKPNWQTDRQGAEELSAIAQKIRKKCAGKKYDCIIGISGGTDSSYLAYVAKEVMGLRPLLLTVNTGWNVDLADQNVDNIARKLGLDLITQVVDWEEMKDLQVAFLKSHVPYQDLPQDHVIFAAIYNYAAEHGIKYVLTGANYSTECVKPPNEWTYTNDMIFIKDIHKLFGTRELKTLPLCNMFKYKLYYRYVKGIHVIKPLNYVQYEKEKAEHFLREQYGWKNYQNKHYENIFTRFYEGYYMPRKFGYDKRKTYLSSLILTGQMSREEALRQINQAPYNEETALADMEYIAQKLGVSMHEMRDFISGDTKMTFRDYRNSYSLIRMAIWMARALGIERRNLR